MVSFILRYKFTLGAAAVFLALLGRLMPQGEPPLKPQVVPKIVPQVTYPMLATPTKPVEVPRKPVEAPEWALKGIAKVETRSSILEDGRIIYRDRRVGSLGERGPFQMRKVAFRQVAKPGERFLALQEDPEFAMVMADRYLLWLRGRFGTWESAVAAYNAGTPRLRAGWRYLSKVKRNADI